MKKGFIIGIGLFTTLSSATGLANTDISSTSVRHIANIKESKVSPNNFSNRKQIHKAINPLTLPASSGALPTGASLYEDFENIDTNVDGWLPEGWSIISESEEGIGDSQKWSVERGDGFYVITPEGDYGATISYGADRLMQDERLVTPQVKIRKNDQLSFMLFSSPVFFYDLEQGTIDYQTGEFKGEKILKGDLTVEIKEEGGEWQQVWSMMEEFGNVPILELLYYNDVESFTIDLAEFEEKNVEIAFRYKAKDAHTVMIDAVRVGFSSLEGISYSNPPETLYWGMDRSQSWVTLNFTIAQYPVNAPITWHNDIVDAGITYQWEYEDPMSKNITVSDAQEELSVTYLPDYSSESTCKNNLYAPPVLRGSAPNTVDGSYKSDISYLQAGGKPEFLANIDDNGTKVMLNMGLLPFDLNKYDLNFMVADFEKVNDHAVPVFGYNSNTGALWLNYIAGENVQANDDVQLTGILNWLYPAEAPLVVTGAHVLALGKDIAPEVEFKVDIVPLDEAGMPLDIVIATAVCKAQDMVRNPYSNLPYEMLNILFDFSEPVIIDKSYPAYMVRLSGFNNERVGTFIPVQSYLPDEKGLCLGFVETANKLNGAADYTTTYIPMANIEGEFGPCYNAFAIHIDGYYPWLDCEEEEVLVPDDGTSVKVQLGSYYDGSELKFSNTSGIDVTASGRYNNCVLNVKRNNTDENVTDEITITAPGVSKKIKVKKDESGIADIISENENIEAIYTLDGTKITGSLTTPGIYIVKFTDGRIRKVIR